VAAAAEVLLPLLLLLPLWLPQHHKTA